MPDGLEIRITTPGSETLGDLRQEVKELKKELLGLIPGTKAFADASHAVSVKQTDVNKAMSMGWSESAKMKDAYFRTGLEVRQLILSSGLLGKGLGQLGDAFGSSVMNAMQLRRALSLAGIAMGGIQVGIVAAVSAGISLISFLKDSAEKSKEATKELRKLRQEYIDLTFERDKASLAMRLNEIDARIRLLKGQMATGVQHFVPFKGWQEGEKKGFETRTRPLTDEEIKANQERRNEIVKLEIEANNQKKPVIKAESDLIDKKFELLRKSTEFDYSLMSGAPRTTAPFRLSQGKKSTFFGELKTPSMWGSGNKEIEDGIDKAKPKASELSNILESGAQSFSRALVTGLANGVGMAQMLVDTLLQIGINVASMYLTSLLPGGGAVAGMAGAGAKTVGGSAAPSIGPKMITPISAQRGGGPSMMGGLHLRTEISGRNLALIVESGDKELAFTRY